MTGCTVVKIYDTCRIPKSKKTHTLIFNKCRLRLVGSIYSIMRGCTIKFLKTIVPSVLEQCIVGKCII